MADIIKIQAVWTGFTGAPGYTTWYFGAGTTTQSVQMRAFFDAIKGLIPSTVSVQVGSTGLLIEDSTGAATGTWTTAAQTVVVGTAVGTYSAPAGAVVNWLTSAYIGGRRLRGRSFLVPLSGNVYQNDGTLGTTSLGTLQTAATAEVTASGTSFIVWKRPVGGAGGTQSPVTSSIVPDKCVVLRSRRD